MILALFFQETLNHQKQVTETVLHWKQHNHSIVISSQLSYYSSRYWVGWMILNKIVTWNIEVTGVVQC